MKRVVITIEGAQGVGKHTIAHMIAETLCDLGWNVTVNGERPLVWPSPESLPFRYEHTVEIFTQQRDIDGGLHCTSK